jgi:hypothetical protein
MNSDRKIAIIVGILTLISAITYGVGSSFFAPVLYGPDYLTNLNTITTQVVIGMLFELTTALSVVGIPVMLFPILKRYSETIAIGYLSFRMIEAIMIIVSEIFLLSLLTLSTEFVKSGAPDVSYFQTFGMLLITGRYWTCDMVLIPLTMGYLMFFYLLYKTKLVPRFISIWGLVGMISFLIAVLIGLFDYNPGMFQKFESNIAVFMGLPGAMSEIVLAIWLIFKGFNPPQKTNQS